MKRPPIRMRGRLPDDSGGGSAGVRYGGQNHDGKRMARKRDHVNKSADGRGATAIQCGLVAELITAGLTVVLDPYSEEE